jgi:hypothetical protein
MSLPLDADELADQLRVEFRDDAQDRLDLIYQTLEKRVANVLSDDEALGWKPISAATSPA